MKRVTQAVVLAFSSLLVFAPATRVAAAVDVDVSAGFYEALSPYGDWIDHPRFWHRLFRWKGHKFDHLKELKP